MSDACSVCPAPALRQHLVMTGGGHDYHACSPPHAQAVWDALDGSGAADALALSEGVAPCPWPVTNPPDWLAAEGPAPATGTLDDLAAWLAVPAHAKAIRAFRGD